MISNFFIDRPLFATVVSAFIVIAGLAAFRELPVAMYPNIAPPQISVSTFYPGVRSQDAATPIRLAAGADQYDVDFALQSDRPVRVSGALVDPSGHTFEDVRASLRALRSGAEGTVPLELNARGEFDARDVVPGTYAIDITDPRRPKTEIDDGVGPAAEVDGRNPQRLVHRHDEVAGAVDAAS